MPSAQGQVLAPPRAPTPLPTRLWAAPAKPRYRRVTPGRGGRGWEGAPRRVPRLAGVGAGGCEGFPGNREGKAIRERAGGSGRQARHRHRHRHRIPGQSGPAVARGTRLLHGKVPSPGVRRWAWDPLHTADTQPCGYRDGHSIPSPHGACGTQVVATVRKPIFGTAEGSEGLAWHGEHGHTAVWSVECSAPNCTAWTRSPH